ARGRARGAGIRGRGARARGVGQCEPCTGAPRGHAGGRRAVRWRDRVGTDDRRDGRALRRWPGRVVVASSAASPCGGGDDGGAGTAVRAAAAGARRAQRRGTTDAERAGERAVRPGTPGSGVAAAGDPREDPVDQIVNDTFDVVVVGGGPGGSSTATFLADGGLRVALFERERFPRFHVGESLMPATMLLLDQLGVKAAIEERGFQLKYGAEFHDEENGASQTFYFLPGQPWP